ncbi:MAG: DctP family TRAP transporter solute-binding subunit [Desulfohalobiaceae bacterium]|nr:DctP family TRAP transporter solute-binding subunit [Desulfohalobiaceae bacterium]
MKSQRSVFSGLLVFFFLLGMLGQTGWAQTILKCGTSTQPSHIYNQAVRHLEKIVEERTKGEIDIQLFPAAQLGSERDMVEGLQLGSLEMTLTSTGPLGNFVPQVKLLNLPFLFKDRESCYSVLDGKIGSDIADLFVEVGIRSLGWYENGFRNITNSKRPIEKPGDMEGLKIRVMEDDVFILTMKALGASPLPMAFGELYTALEQGTVDAQENPLAVIHSSRFFEVQDYLAMTGHFYSPAMLLISEMTWQSLSPEHQEILREAAAEARDYERQISKEADANLLEELKKEGMTVTNPDKEPFVEAVSGVYENPKVVKAIGDGDMEKGQALIDAARDAAQ